MQTILKVTDRGLVSLPKKMRAAMGLHGNDHLIAEVTPQGLLLKNAITLPIERYHDARIREFDEAEAELAAVLKTKQRRLAYR